MTLDWTLLLDADMTQADIWQLSGETDAEILRIEQENPPEIGRFALAQVSPDGSEFLQTNAYPARAESTRINLEYVGFGQKLIAIRYRYAQLEEEALPWRIKIYGSKSGYQPPINPSAIILTLDPRVAGAIPLEEKGIAEGVAELDAEGIVPLDQLPPWGELIGANLEATDALADQIASLPPPPTLENLGGEPAGAENRSKAYTDLKISEIPPAIAPTLAELGGEPAGAEQRARNYTDQKISEIPPPIAPTLAELGGEPAGAETRSKAYTDQQIDALPPPTTLAELGGEPSGAETRAKAYTDNLINQLITRLDKLEGDYPTTFTHFWGLGNPYNGTTQKGWTKSNSGNNDFARFAAVTSAAQNDTVEFKFPLKAGSYTLEISHLKRPGDGIISFYIDDALIGTLDAYNSTTTNINRYSLNFTLSTTGTHTFKAVVASKNASSTGYAFAASAALIYPALAVPAVNLVLINCGDQQSYTATDGRVWSADQYFSGGVRTDLESALGAFTVANTQNQRLYKFERALDNGTFTYSIPIGQPGTFTVKLLFAENYHSSAGQRVGSVSINGATYLSNYDIFVAAGGKNRAVVEAWNGIAMPSSTVTISVTNTLINGIELVRTA